MKFHKVIINDNKRYYIKYSKIEELIKWLEVNGMDEKEYEYERGKPINNDPTGLSRWRE